MTLEDDVKKLVETHERYDKENAENKIRTEERERGLTIFILVLVTGVGIGIAFGLILGYDIGWSYAVNRAVDLVGPWIRAVMVR